MLMTILKNVYQKDILIQLGIFLSSVSKYDSWPGYKCGVSETEFFNFKSAIKIASTKNSWFSINMINRSIEIWSNNLSQVNLDKWMSNYDIPEKINKNVLIICAGNLPLVGLHDIICCISLDLNTQIKLSKNDDILIPAVLEVLAFFDNQISDKFKILDNNPVNFNTVIATGSNNSNRYFNHYFGNHPHIFRKNRTSIAVIDQHTSDQELNKLSDDILQYYGLGCRSVTKLFVHESFDLNRIYQSVFNYKNLASNNKYMNNYDYNRSIFLLEKKLFFDNGFLILKEDKSLFSPISVVNYEFYSDLEFLEKELLDKNNEIQCRVGVGGISFGTAQKPDLWDYADGVDTIDFLTKI